jgi:hypothetical protein
MSRSLMNEEKRTRRRIATRSPLWIQAAHLSPPCSCCGVRSTGAGAWPLTLGKNNMNLAIVTSIAAFTVCSCQQRQQEARASMEAPASPNQSSEEIHSSNEKVRKIEGWDIGVIGSGSDKRFVEWTSRKPIAEMQTGSALASKDWGFAVMKTQEGIDVVEWPSMKPIEAGRSTEDQINQDDTPPMPKSRWSR